MKYTLSDLAYTTLLSLLTKPPSRTTLWRRNPTTSIDAFGKPVRDAPLVTTTQGLSNTLRLLPRYYDLDDWTAKPDKQTGLYYIPADQDFLSQPIDDLSNNELLDYQRERSLLRHQHNLALDAQTRAYYSNLLLHLHISLPTRPSIRDTWIARQRDNLTTRVSFCLEAIGTKHILLPAGYTEVVQLPNRRLDHASRRAKQPNEAWGLATTDEPKYGNHNHTVAPLNRWIALPSKPARYTQEHVDFCCRPYVRLEDLAQEACRLNPSLIYRPVRDVPNLKPALGPSTEPRAKPKRQLTFQEPEPPLYLYNGRDVTEAVLQAHELHYVNGIKFSDMLAILNGYGLKYNTLRLLVHREQLRQRAAQQAQQRS